jgi:16S rRNA (guanine527-N7)-methyltransferase
MATPTLTDTDLQSVLVRHAIELPQAQIELLQRYCEALWSWNERLNLTRHLDFETFVVRDLLDTSQLAQHLEPEERVLDVGTGGGVPGVVLAILRSDLHVSLSEPVKKKARAVSAIVQQLQLSVPVFPMRVQEALVEHRCQTLVARAVGPLRKVLGWLSPHWGEFGRLLLIKGPNWVQERQDARHRGCLAGLELRRLATYQTPGHDGESVVLAIRRKQEHGAAR